MLQKVLTFRAMLRKGRQLKQLGLDRKALTWSLHCLRQGASHYREYDEREADAYVEDELGTWIWSDVHKLGGK